MILSFTHRNCAYNVDNFLEPVNKIEFAGREIFVFKFKYRIEAILRALVEFLAC